MTNPTKKIILLLVGLLMAAGLSACGKRATRLDPPDASVPDEFPRVYPDPATDPKPEGQ